MLRSIKALCVMLPGLLLLCLPVATQAGTYSNNGGEQAYITQAELPPEARDTLRLIRRNGPFPYPRDGMVFGNFEQRLPRQPRGHYHEYTVRTPGEHSRGMRRIVCGTVPECYYTGDHYRTFQRIRE